MKIPNKTPQTTIFHQTNHWFPIISRDYSIFPTPPHGHQPTCSALQGPYTQADRGPAVPRNYCVFLLVAVRLRLRRRFSPNPALRACLHKREHNFFDSRPILAPSRSFLCSSSSSVVARSDPLAFCCVLLCTQPSPKRTTGPPNAHQTNALFSLGSHSSGGEFTRKPISHTQRTVSRYFRTVSADSEAIFRPKKLAPIFRTTFAAGWLSYFWTDGPAADREPRDEKSARFSRWGFGVGSTGMVGHVRSDITSG